jgi:aspartyl-tRNA(Asn)/glutamyl-tRNA(Gln) amidotransferase subunit B
MNWEPVIGLEVHAQLKTKTKIFCGCPTDFGSAPNDQVCPVCLGMPGMLPVLNGKAVEFAIRAGLALNCTIAESTRFDRKNYFYPDLPKGYQISQYDRPICSQGYLTIGSKKIRIHRAHLEEDAGKLVHAGAAGLHASEYSKVDFNRSGVPLLEIVSEPDISDAEEARLYLTELRNILRYLGVCDGNLEEGSFRCDANVSVRPVGSDKLGTKTEIKNMNSFQSVKNAIQSEIDRQIAALERGERVVQETRLWSDPDKTTFVMRSKEEAHDYRYFPEPDLVPLVIDRKWVEEIRATIPELPESRRQRYISKYGVSLEDAMVLAESKDLSDFFDTVLNMGVPAKQAANYLLNSTIGYLKENKLEFSDLKLTAENLHDVVEAVSNGKISATAAKSVLNVLLGEAGDVRVTIGKLGLEQVSDESALREQVKTVLSSSPSQLDEYRKGRTKVRQYFFGEVMKASKGKANPQIINKLLDELLPPAQPANV